MVMVVWGLAKLGKAIEQNPTVFPLRCSIAAISCAQLKNW
jgi:hypothetical protein